MAHPSNIVTCNGPEDPHAFDIVPLQPRKGELDAQCPLCHGHGEWNTEIDLVSFRCKRAICGRCNGAGWVETGNDPVGYPDIEIAPDGHPRWVINYVPREDVAAEEAADPADGGTLIRPVPPL
jgi:hypothetical protein